MPVDDESLPGLDSSYALSTDQIAEYQRDGHILLRSVASPSDIGVFRPVIAEAVRRNTTATPPLADRDSYHKAFLQVANLWESDEAVARFVMSRRFACVAADLMGVAGVRIYHDQALFKEPGGAATPWHQDQYYWPVDTANTITMWLPLVDVPVDRGVLTFASGSHLEGCLAMLPISDESHQCLGKQVKERGFPIVRNSMSAGDATFHSGWTLHFAPANSTDVMREIMTIIYIAEGARVSEPVNPHQPADLKRWFPDLAPGDAAASRLNPLVYQR